MEKEIEKLLNELFDLIGIKAGFTISKVEDVYKVEIDSKDSSGLIIGAHGATLSAIQSFLTIAINNAIPEAERKEGEWIKISVDVAHWSEKQNEKLIELATQTASRAKQTKEEQRLYNLNPYQRRIIHVALLEDTEIETTSEGEGEDRYLIVRVK